MRGLPVFLIVLFAVALGTFESTVAIAQSSSLTDYLGSGVCRDCHDEAYAKWSRSHHAWALKKPSRKTVLGDFASATFDHLGQTTRFSKRDGSFLIETDGPDGKSTEYPVAYVVGVEPLQQYLVETNGGRLQAIDVAWDTERGRWFHLYPDDTAKSGDGLHWTGPYKNWQARCATCHQTNFKKHYNAETNRYQSTWSELTVGCEACHGPGSAHVAWARNPNRFDPVSYKGADERGLLVAYLDSREGAKREIETCGPCHSRREAIGPDSPPPGAAFDEHHTLALLRPELYHADGRINDEVYVYGSFIQSKMHKAGVRCSNCHKPHSGELIAEGNAVCTQCHNETGREEFPSLPLAAFDTPEHHHHFADGEAAQCVSCHMPAMAYMIVDPRRDHSFRVPRPDLSVTLGTPNACTGCHDDQSAEWAAGKVEAWFPGGRSGQPHFATVFHEARTAPDGGTLADLIKVARDTDAAAIVRATAVELTGALLANDSIMLIVPLLADEEALVRRAAIDALAGAPASLRGRFIAPLIDDPVRSVKYAATLRTIDLPTTGLSVEERQLVADARRDLQLSLHGRADFPETHMQLGGVALTTRNLQAADAAFKKATDGDPQLVAAWNMRARIASAEGRFDDARQYLQDAIVHNSDSPFLHRSLGNVLLELNQTERALSAFQIAREHAPEDVAIAVDLAAALTRLERSQDALDALRAARRNGGDGPLMLELRAINNFKLGHTQTARDVASDLARRFPSHTPSEEFQALF